MNRFRRRRFDLFFEHMGVSDDTHVIDVGGLPWDWIKLGFRGQVTCVSLSKIREERYGAGHNIEYVRFDATALPFEANRFDVAYSNSLLKHVGRENQARVASDIRRVSKRYWVQVPCRTFPYEPHYSALFFYSLPKTWRRWIAKNWTPLVKRTNSYLREVDTIWPLLESELRILFPDAHIWHERFLGLTKSLVAWQVRQ